MPHVLKQIWLCYPCVYRCECYTYSRKYGCIILVDMAVNATHTPADMVVLSLRIWLQTPHIIQQLWLCYLCGYGWECHTYSSRYGCVILVDMALNATHTPADMVVLSLRIMAVNATHTQADMVVLSLRIWVQMPHILQQIWSCYP